MSDIVYLLTYDGYKWGYGCEIFCAGIFTAKEDAEKALAEIEKNDESLCPIIDEIKVDMFYKPIYNDRQCAYNKHDLGGYWE